MLKLTLAAMVAALMVPALAHAGTVRGTVVARQAHRHVLVVASRHGHVESARVSPSQLHRTPLGARLVISGKRLADGSLRVTRMRRLGQARRARLHVVVMKAKARRLLVAGGGSAFSIRLTRGTRLLASTSGPSPGEKVDAEVQFSDGSAVEETMQASGQAPLVDFSGVVTAIDATSVTVSSDGIATVVQLPNGVTLPPLVQVGSDVEVVASISGAALTLTTIKLDGDSSGNDGGTSVDDQGQVQAEGFVTALDANSITIQPGDSASPATFAIPTGFTLPTGLVVGASVEARGEMVSSVLTLTQIDLKNDGESQGLEAEGAVTALDAGSITIQTEDSGSPITFTIPTGFALPAGLAVGSFVDARGAMLNGTATLTEIEVKSEDGGQVEARGSVTALDSSSITIQDSDSPNPVTFVIPAGFTLPAGLAVGNTVDAQGQYVNGVLTLTQIQSDDGG
ncbi:MAG TPA: DUF5666 domain-containing protein [Gaiellaceae bacterium]|nr:DUF5666 domain-containing protein [Gaiellaceae bacterium]